MLGATPIVLKITFLERLYIILKVAYYEVISYGHDTDPIIRNTQLKLEMPKCVYTTFIELKSTVYNGNVISNKNTHVHKVNHILFKSSILEKSSNWCDDSFNRFAKLRKRSNSLIVARKSVRPFKIC